MTVTPSTVAPLPQSAPSFDVGHIVSAVWASSTWLAVVHLLVNLPLGILWFTMLAVGLSLGAGLAITLLGIPVLVGTGWLVRAAGGVERTRMNTCLGTTLRDPYRPSVPGARWITRLFAIATDPATWRDFVFLMLRLPIGLFTFTAVCVVWTLATGLLLSPLSIWFGAPRITIGAWVVTGPAAVMGVTLCGAVMIVAAAWLTRGLATLERLLGRALLDASPEVLQQRVAALAGSRTRIISAADQARRRLERDLHDGPQQRLVSLAMTLGLAQQKLSVDPEQGARLVGEAHDEAKRALQDLRDLAHGLHPAVLTDHGLASALPALAARCPIPTRVDVAVSPRPAPEVESAAYFVVAEALTNAARHSRAQSVAVTLRCEDDRLMLEIRDDGAGEAREVPGGGLAGLTDRVEALGGHLTVSSPAGGPTVIHVEMPCVL